jgi:hypothetical protein
MIHRRPRPIAGMMCRSSISQSVNLPIDRRFAISFDDILPVLIA